MPRKERSRSVTPWIGYTRYRPPACTSEKTKKREVLVETSVETSSGEVTMAREGGTRELEKEEDERMGGRNGGCRRMKR